MLQIISTTSNLQSTPDTQQVKPFSKYKHRQAKQTRRNNVVTTYSVHWSTLSPDSYDSTITFFLKLSLYFGLLNLLVLHIIWHSFFFF